MDDLGRWFDGKGIELALRYELGERFSIEAGYNDLSPYDAHPGNFRIRYGLGYLVRTFHEVSKIFAGVRVEDSRNSDNTRSSKTSLAGGIYYTF